MYTLCCIVISLLVCLCDLMTVFASSIEPRFSISREPGFGVPLIEGMRVYLKCDVDSEPPSMPKWIRDTTPGSGEQSKPIIIRSTSDGKLIFPSIAVQDSGWYRCTTEHNSKQYSSFGYLLSVQNASAIPFDQIQKALKQPTVPSISLDNIANRGTGNVHSNHRQTSSSYPSHNGYPMLNSGSYPSHPSGARPQSIPDFTSTSDCYNKFDGRPIVISHNRTIMATAGRPIAFFAQFCCDPKPTKVFWIHRHLSIVPGRTIGPYASKQLSMDPNSRNCYTSTFLIDTPKLEDAGEVIFIAGNVKGLTDAVLFLNVSRASFSVSKASYQILKADTMPILIVITLIKVIAGS